jgi:hypothetical protein
MNWIDKLNKELEERIERNKTPEAKEDAKQRVRSWASSQGGKTASKINKQSGQLDKLHKSENRIEKVKDSLESRTFEERSELSKKGWAREDAKKEHVTELGKVQGKKNIERLGKFTSDKEHQSKAGSIGGKKGGKVMGNKEHTCPHCGKQGKGPIMFRYHMNNCKLVNKNK